MSPTPLLAAAANASTTAAKGTPQLGSAFKVCNGILYICQLVFTMSIQIVGVILAILSGMLSVSRTLTEFTDDAHSLRRSYRF